MNVMLLAAGEGQRLRPYTLETPKPAIPFLTVPLAAFSLSLLDQLKISKLLINTYHLPLKIENLFHWMKLPTKNVIFSHEREQLLDSGGGIHKVKNQLLGDEPFLVMNADEVILPHDWGLITRLLEFHRFHKGIATLLTMPHPEVGKKFGGAWSQTGASKIDLFSKTAPPSSPSGHHYLGVMVLEPRIFKYFKDFVEPENILYDTLTKAMASGEEVHAFDCQCEWFEIGNPPDFLNAAQLCIEGLSSAPEKTWCQYLAQTIRVYGEGKVLIEASNPNLLAQIRNVFRQQMIRFDEP